MQWRSLAVLPTLILLSSALSLHAQPATSPPPTSPSTSPPTSPPQKVAQVEGFTEYALSNGLRVVFFPDNSKPIATVNITYRVGSRYENYGETGMAHLLEHMLFRGSQGHPNINQELTSHGSRPNGTTWLDRTNYFETFTSTDENLTWALDLEADRMINSLFRPEDLEAERTIVRNELELGENMPINVLEERVVSSAYLWHNNGKSTIGARSDILSVPLERVKTFYQTWYQPDNAVLIVAGKFEPDKTLNLIERKFGSIPRPSRVLPKLYTVEPAQDGERTVTLKRVGDIQAIMAAYHVPGASHPDFVALEALTNILADTPSGRLHKSLVETQLAVRVSAYNYAFEDPSVMLIQARVPKGSPLEPAQAAFLKELDEIGSRPPTDQEVTRAKESLLRDWQQRFQNTESVATYLSTWVGAGDWRLLFIYRDRLEALTTADVAAAAKAYLRPANRTLGVYLPTDEAERVEIPPNPDVTALVRDYQGRKEIDEGQFFLPTCENIEAHLVRQTLPSGMKVVLSPRETRGNLVVVQIRLYMGDEKMKRAQLGVGEMAAGMLLRGTKNRSRAQIQDELDQLKATLYLDGGARMVYAGLEVNRENLNAALELIDEVLKTPALDATEFERLKQQKLAQLEAVLREPSQRAQTELDRYLNPYATDDIRYRRTIQERADDLRTVTLEQVRAFYDTYYGASAGYLVMVGDLDAKEQLELSTRYFGNWRSKVPFVRLKSPYQDRKPISLSLETPDKESAFMAAGIRLKLQDTDPDYPAMEMATYMLGGGFLNSRLGTRIRVKEGLSYSVYGYVYASAIEPSGYFGASAAYAPQNDSRLMTAFREELDRAVMSGFTEEELEEARNGWLMEQEVSRSDLGELAGQLAGLEFEGRTLAWQAQFEEKVRNLRAKQLNAALKRVLNPAKVSIVRAGDFARAKTVEPDKK